MDAWQLGEFGFEQRQLKDAENMYNRCKDARRHLDQNIHRRAMPLHSLQSLYIPCSMLISFLMAGKDIEDPISIVRITAYEWYCTASVRAVHIDSVLLKQ